MIQRIQSVFLFLAAVLSGVTIFSPIAKFQTGASTGYFELLNVATNVPGVGISNAMLLSLLAVASLGSLIAIFLFKKRNSQAQLAVACGILSALFIGLVIYKLNIFDQSSQRQGAVMSYSFGLFLPIGALICNFVAARFIKKDEKLVRSADRMR